MNERRFQRTVENFRCLHCGVEVTGDGYTNHCPACLWSRHVDVNPGDRAERCQAPMRPIWVEVKGGERWLTHRCEACRAERRIRLRPQDSMDAVLELMRLGLSGPQVK